MALNLQDVCKIEAWEGLRGAWDCIIRAAYFVHGFLVVQIDGGCHSVHDFFWVQWWRILFSTIFSFCLWWWFSFWTRFCAHWLPPSPMLISRGSFDKSNILQNARKTAKRLYLVLPCSSWCRRPVAGPHDRASGGASSPHAIGHVDANSHSEGARPGPLLKALYTQADSWLAKSYPSTSFSGGASLPSKPNWPSTHSSSDSAGGTSIASIPAPELEWLPIPLSW